MVEIIDYLRHGETEDLAIHKRRSRQDTPLTDTGLAEARAAASRIKEEGIEYDLIICSPLERTRRTAETIAEVLGYPTDKIEFLLDLREREWGIAEGMLNTSIQKRWPDGFDTVPFAENEAELHYRAQTVVRRLLQRPEPRILVVGHGTLGRQLRDVANNQQGSNLNDESGKIKTGEVFRLYQRQR